MDGTYSIYTSHFFLSNRTTIDDEKQRQIEGLFYKRAK